MAEIEPLVLLVEDDRAMAGLVAEYLAGEAIDLLAVETGQAALDAIDDRLPDVILLDLKLPDMDGFDILRSLQDRELPVETIVITGHGSMSVAIEAMQLGARDFMVKPFAKERLVTTVRNVLDRQSLTRIVQTYREEIDRVGFCGFIGSSLVMQGIYRMVESAAPSKATVFITGESGTGKEVCAEAIHALSPRAKGPFIAINCGAIPKDLIESEIFGHVKGAFTGAVGNRPGAAREADGGTLFLDEICEMDIALQPKLLRFLQTGTIQPVGSSQAVPVDVRIICATNRDPAAEVVAGHFREDLYYRLHVLPILLPSLRDRDEDVLEIAKHFVRQYAREEGKSFQGLAADAQAAIAAYAWPGNVRELQNTVRQAVVLNDGDELTADMLPPAIKAGAGKVVAKVTPVASVLAPVIGATGTDPAKLIRPMADLEREAIEHAIEVCDGNVPAAAHYLEISAATIYRKKAAWKKGA